MFCSWKLDYWKEFRQVTAQLRHLCFCGTFVSLNDNRVPRVISLTVLHSKSNLLMIHELFIMAKKIEWSVGRLRSLSCCNEHSDKKTRNKKLSLWEIQICKILETKYARYDKSCSFKKIWWVLALPSPRNLVVSVRPSKKGEKSIK